MDSQLLFDWGDNFAEIQRYQAAMKLLQDTKQLIHDENLWCQSIGALDSNGKPVHYSDAEACRFCLSYAYERAALDTSVEHRWHCNFILDSALSQFGFGRGVHEVPMTIKFNDHRDTTHANVIMVLDIGITACETRLKEGVLIDGKTLTQRDTERYRAERATSGVLTGTPGEGK